MKKLILLLLVVPILAIGQTKERLSRAYIAVMLHDLEATGISLVNNFGINRYLGVGAGVDVTKYDGEMLVPVYADVRVKYPVNGFAPFVALQGGYPLYNKSDNAGFTDVTGRPVKTKTMGKYFFGGGVGLSYKAGKVGGYLSYIQRAYHYRHTNMEINGRDYSPNNPESAGVLALGLIF